MQAATRLTQPVELVQVPLFNPTASYSSYVVPAAFVLILHQTLLMGAATLGGAAFEHGGLAARRTRASATAILGQGLAHWTLYMPAMLLYFVVMPRVYGFSTLGSVWALDGDIRSLHPGDELSRAGARPRVPPSGDGGPAGVGEQPAAILPGWRVLAGGGAARLSAQGAQSLPSVDAIDGIVRINQMGAMMAEVRPDWLVSVGADVPLFRHCRGAGAASRRAGRELCRRPSRRTLLFAIVPAAGGRRARDLALVAGAGEARPWSRGWCGPPKSASRRRSAAVWRAILSNRGKRCSADSRWRCLPIRSYGLPSARPGRR